MFTYNGIVVIAHYEFCIRLFGLKGVGYVHATHLSTFTSARTMQVEIQSMRHTL